MLGPLHRRSLASSPPSFFFSLLVSAVSQSVSQWGSLEDRRCMEVFFHTIALGMDGIEIKNRIWMVL